MTICNTWRSAAIVAAMVLAMPGHAGESLTLAEALQRAAESHPDLQGFVAERDELAAQRDLAGHRPVPELGLLLEDAVGTGDRSGLDAAQWTLSYSQALEQSGYREARIAVSDARASALAAQHTQRRLDALAEVTQRFIEAAASAQRLQQAEQQLGLARQALEAVHKRVAAARAPAADEARAQAALAQARLQREHAQHERQTARVALAVSLGVAEPDFGELHAELLELPPLRTFEELRRGVEQSPAARARLAGIAALEAEQRAALKSGDLRPTLSGGLRGYEQGNDIGFVLGVTLPLGTPARARDLAGVSAAQIAQGAAEHDAALLRTHERLYAHYQELQHARTALELMTGEVLPALERALAQTRAAYEQGRYGYLELAQVQHDHAAARREQLDAAVRYHSLLAELERLSGEDLIERRTP